MTKRATALLYKAEKNFTNKAEKNFTNKVA